MVLGWYCSICSSCIGIAGVDAVSVSACAEQAFLYDYHQVLGKGGEEERAQNLSTVLDGYFKQGGHHINVNVLNRELLMDAVEHPEK